jgi:uncharacterized protein DUF5675
MLEINLIRFEESDHGARGKFYLDDDFFCYSMEPPWRDNLPNHSCIPEGSYRCIWHQSPRYGWVYLLTNVLDRAQILIHSGNYGGDAIQGFKTHTKGCILLGRRLGVLSNQRVVLASRPIIRIFNDLMDKKEFILSISHQ